MAKRARWISSRQYMRASFPSEIDQHQARREQACNRAECEQCAHYDGFSCLKRHTLRKTVQYSPCELFTDKESGNG